MERNSVKVGKVECTWNDKGERYEHGKQLQVFRLVGGAGTGWLAIYTGGSIGAQGETAELAAAALTARLVEVLDG
jgi:hypothetical protein